MPDHRGYRAKSRDIFSKKRSGMPKPSKLINVRQLILFLISFCWCNLVKKTKTTKILHYGIGLQIG